MSAERKIVPLRDLAGIGGVLAHGTFDLLHIGHVRYFKEAAKLGPLTVTLTGDKYIRHHGPGRPVFPEDLRAEMIAELECVKNVAIVHEETGFTAIKTIRPVFYCKGDETRREGNDGLYKEISLVESLGGRVVFVPKKLPYSSGKLLSGEILARSGSR
jgi:cytidyltransferase-like protein